MSKDSIAAVNSTAGSPPPASVNGINGIAGNRAPKQVMDSEVFMNLLVAQLRHQDPSSPMDTNQMISQTTQLATMEKLTNMDSTATENFALQMRTSAAALIGQQVSWEDADGTKHSGVATSVSFAGGVPQVTVGDKSVPLDVISGVTTVPAANDAPPETKPPPEPGPDTSVN
ncbi:flagellar hook assembly protein FlgD [Arthrobacter glacialis]|uniref:Flagellar hook capping protein n=1 Tax=Arthrobacter glacialis TaxID=1664 RepID=A0A2S3ZXB7_ARTGL|nr:flagellar hook capping FlgD N-terminal domain-containing protein [Arthrobacter glacialis]POH73850.1 flagellar hook capping protein [Arthrobacter glacialis]